VRGTLFKPTRPPSFKSLFTPLRSEAKATQKAYAEAILSRSASLSQELAVEGFDDRMIGPLVPRGSPDCAFRKRSWC
jgi:hypothetical protein